MQNKVSLNKAFLLSHHCCSFRAVFSAVGGGRLQSQHGFRGKTNQEASGSRRKLRGGSVYSDVMDGGVVFGLLVKASKKRRTI